MSFALRQTAVTLATGALLLTLLVVFGDSAVRALQPAMQAVFEHCVPEFKVLSFGLQRERADDVVQVLVSRQRYVVLGGQAIEPNSRGTATASTLLLQTLFGPLLALWVSLAWPIPNPRRRMHQSTQTPTGSRVQRAGLRSSLPLTARLVMRLTLAFVLAVMLAVVDTPVVLGAQLWALMVDHFTPGNSSPLIALSAMLQGGGRYALGLAAGVVAVAVADRIVETVCPTDGDAAPA